MAMTPSNMLPLGTSAPDFDLADVSGGRFKLADAQGKPLLVMFICNHCPYVKHIADELARLGDDFLPRGVAIVAINSNDAEKYPDDAPDKMREEKAARGYRFPYLFDETQTVAKAFDAACTPDLFLFDRQHRLVYRGQLDASRPGNKLPVTGSDLRQALEAVLANQAISADQKPAVGCNIKWRQA